MNLFSRRAAIVFGKALVLGACLGLAMRLVGVIGDLRASLAINMIFSGVMWPVFEICSPWYSPRSSEARSPGATALISLGKTLLLFGVLAVFCAGLVKLATGINLLARPQSVVLTVFAGVAVTALMSSLHTTASLVTAERARAMAEVDKMRMEFLEKENARKSLELEEARSLQLLMLPADGPERNDVAVAFGMRTASEVGGDYYDFREMPDGGLELALGDATGHGTKAGLLVVAAKTLFQTEAAAGSPASALSRANQGIKSLNLSRMNMALCRVSIGAGAVKIASAGMPPALHYRAATGDVVEIVNNAPPAGQLKSARYSDREIPFSAGDRLLLFSDGFPECVNADGDQMGYERSQRAFSDVAEQRPDEIITSLFAAAAEWAGGRDYEDDISFLVVASLGPSERGVQAAIDAGRGWPDAAP